jgi:hypothetical protein
MAGDGAKGALPRLNGEAGFWPFMTLAFNPESSKTRRMIFI